MRSPSRTLVLATLSLAAACGQRATGTTTWNTALDASAHAAFFPIAAGSKHALGSDSPAIDCNSCHGSADSFKQFDCLSCHQHADQSKLALGHRNVAKFNFASGSCYSCHPRGDAGGTLPAGSVSDPARNLKLDAQIPSYVETSISSFTLRTEILPMPMDHGTKSVAAAAFSSCANCHGSGASGAYYPGDFHSSLASLKLAQPTSCAGCHASSMPTGFVGPTATNPARTPPSSEMKHDAVLWTKGAPTGTAAVTQDCAVCHSAPTAMSGTWAANTAGTTPALFHASLTAASLLQPASCLDCHANSRPGGVVTVAASHVQFDHSAPAARADCTACHQGTTPAAQWTSWAGGRFHQAGDATPASCLPCHEGERPTTTSGWTSPTYASAPFDYVPNAQGITHGAGQDCVACHTGPGTGAWGGTQNWVGGSFAHGKGTLSASTCLACHATQRPDLQPGTNPVAMATLLGFDHSANGTGDCIGCHQATVTANRYQTYFSVAQKNSGDWQGGQDYPGGNLIGTPLQSLTVTEIALQRSGPNNLVTSTSSTSATFMNEMLHTSTAIPAPMFPGPASTPDRTKCFYCHTINGPQGSPYGNGQFHSRVASNSLPQPAQCLDCHTTMRPAGIVEKAASDLQPMDHGAKFTAAVTIAGKPASGVADIDCTVCHKSPGTTWTDGTFHANLNGAVPQDCTVCHYTLMADAAKADLTSGAKYAMKHASGQVTFQNCQLCHASALSQSTGASMASTLWQPGQFHPNLPAQPTACLACHAVSRPAANASTQSSVVYNLPLGGTSTNGAQWMNHGSGALAGKDCVACHAADAKPSGSAWSKSDSFHAAVPGATSCAECHGLSNGGGSVAGTGNNLPQGLTNASMVSSAASDATTGVPAGTFDQINHADLNASSHDCNFCHTQAGASTTSGVQGKEWAQAAFHTRFSSSNPLVMNGTTARCSDCHMNVKPGPTFTAFDHSPFTATSGTQDCNACHSWPGTGTPAAPNWLGATGAPALVTLTNWGYGSPTTNTVTFAHPRPATYTSCAQCHPGTNYAILIDFNHDGLTSSVSINGATPSPTPNLGTSQYSNPGNQTFCVACHSSGSPWVSRTGLSSTIAADTTSGSTTVTTASTSALTQGMIVTGTGIPNTTVTTTTFTANITSGSTTVVTATPVSLPAGTVISGNGIPANDTVATSVNNATTFTLTTAATATISGVTLTATITRPLTVTITSISSTTSFEVSTAANATTTGTTLTVTHRNIAQATIGNHQGSTAGQDCTSCHYVGGNQQLTPPTPGVFGTGSIGG